MKNPFKKKVISVLLCVLLAAGSSLPAFTASAADGVIDTVELQIFYADTNTMVPTYQEGTDIEYIITMVEGEKLQLKYQLIDSVIPDNAYFKWYSENPILVDVDQDGLVKAFDSSKGAVVQLWIDNEVKPIPLIGSRVGELLEKAFNNEYVDLDTLDTDAIVAIAKAALGSESWLADYLDAYEGNLIDSLRDYLDRVNTGVYCQIFSSTGELLAEDHVNVNVVRNNEWYANFLPNGTHITNKSLIATTQAVGNTVQLSAITSPQRLHYGVQYSVKSSSIFSSGKVVATVTDGGLVTFKNKGKVTILASPDSEDVIAGLLKFVNYFYALENTGTLNTDDIAKIMIEYMGLDINRAVLAGMLDVAFGVAKVAQGTADPVQLTATAVEIVANIILQMKYNDSITFTVVDAEPIESFDIEGVKTVKEGSQIQLQLTNVQPSTGNMSDVVWSSSDPTIASVDEKTGVITGLDAGGPYGQLSSKEVQITATSTTNNVSRTVTVTVTGKTGNFISHVDIDGAETVEIGATEDYSHTVYPLRAAESQNLYFEWGLLSDEVDENGDAIYIWATDEQPAQNGISQIDSKGHYIALDGGKSTVALRAYTGYYLSNGKFYEISSCIGTKEVKTGIPVENINISVTGVSNSGGKIASNKTVNVNGVDYQYVTITRSGAYMGNGAVVKASVSPSDSTNQNLRWVVDNSYYENTLSDDTHTATVKQKAGHEVADTFNIYAVSNDGKVKSNVITVCVSNNHAATNSVYGDRIEVINNTQKDVYHTITFDGSLTGSNLSTKKANWYSSDETVFTVENKNNDNYDAVITGRDVGEATIYCVSADNGILDTATIVVKPNKTYLKNIIDLCEKTAILRTEENKKEYQQYMRKLDLAYSVYYDRDMASQTTCDTYAQNLLTAFYRLGGFVSVGSVEILATSKKPLKSKYVTVQVGSTSNYKNYSYDFDYTIKPTSAMYDGVEWSSSSSSVSVDENGVCTPTSNDPCSSVITCKVTDYMGNVRSDSVCIAFARNKATGVSLNTTEMRNCKVGESAQLTATVSPTGISSASVKTVFWESSDESVATVNENGVVTFVYGGDCEIKCTTADGGYTAVCKVNVITNYDPLSTLIQQYTDLNLSEPSYYPETWAVYSEAMKKAKRIVREGGYSQKEVDAMYAELEAAFNQLERYTYMSAVEIYIEGEPTSDFYQYDLNLITESISGEGIGYTNGSRPLKVRLYPNNASYKSVKWESDTSDISITSEGVATPTSNKPCYGKITCTVTDHFGNQCSDYVWVSFAYFPVTALKLSDTNIDGTVGSTYQLACTVEPTGTGYLHIGSASIKDFYWESDDESIATVDENGLVTFVDAGSTIIRAVSYDGGISAECTVSTEGDRSALKAAVENYKDVDYQNYEYSYGQDFKNKYQIAVNALTDLTLSQAQIDSIAQNVVDSAEAMYQHPYIVVENFNLSFETYNDPYVGSDTRVENGSVSDNDHLTINLSRSGYQSNNTRNYIDITASVTPSNASYKALSWSVISSNNLKSSSPTDEKEIRLTPESNSSGWAKIKITATDLYNRETSRIVYIVLADNVATGMTVKPQTLTLFATQTTTALQYTFTGAPDVKALEWSSSDESVVKVNASGAVTPVDKGTAVVTAVSVDGGFVSSANVIIETDFSTLADKVSNYKGIIESIGDEKVYTEESLNTLAAAVQEAEGVLELESATQAEVNSYIETLDAAYNALRRYVPATGVEVVLDGEQSGVSEPNEGFIRFTSSNSIVTNKKIQLKANVLPIEDEPLYESIVWTSSNSLVQVDDLGLVTNLDARGTYSQITCTVTTEEGDVYSDSVYVTFVRYGATEITFDSDKIYGAPAQTKELKANLNQSDQSAAAQLLSVNDCLYSSSNEEIATVDDKGNVTFITQGEATITVTAIDGGYVATIPAYTTWDTTALQEALATAKALDQKDYIAEYSSALQTQIEVSEAVMNNVYASQDEIDTACDNLLAAISNLEGHEFIKPQPTIKVDGEEIQNGGRYVVDENSNITVSYEMNEGAMIKSADWNTKNANGAKASVSGNNLTVTKTNEADSASITVELVTVDDYDRTDVFSYTINVVDSAEAEIVPISEITLSADGEAIENGILTKSGYGDNFSGFEGIQLAYAPTPENASAPASVSWTSTLSSYISVDANGYVTLTEAGRNARLKTLATTITCTVTNADGTTARATVGVTIRRN
ncbi:MAG: Ig-like domain-containing protein [Eubacterium sp.]|nr:Ig-like domain-containing protein [Eubacterium sp.]